MCDSEDHVPQLSAETFAALQEFYKEQELKESKLKKLSNSNEHGDTLTFDENWQLSQFWYDDSTAESLAKVAQKCLEKTAKVALISCPTLYKKFKEYFEEVTLFEYDDRFAVYGNDFILYDYKSPLSIPRNLSNSFDLVIADPPFLSEECLAKTAVTIQFLRIDKIILCTGTIMEELVDRLLHLKKCKFEPKHANNLGNDFSCFANFDVDSFL